MHWLSAFSRFPFVAILRGITPKEILPAFDALYAQGFRFIEVPLNSPQPFESITQLCAHAPEDCWIGAGTVTTHGELVTLAQTGARLAVMPHTDPALIAQARAQDLLCMPGVMTPTEAFSALRAGAQALKLFPAEVIRPEGLRALRAVLPSDLCVLPVGGVTTGQLASWRQAGAGGYGLGSALYQPGMSATQLAERAAAFAAAWQALQVAS